MRLFPQVIFLIFLLLLNVQSACALSDNIEKWISDYYLHPRPDEVAEALQIVSDKGYFENEEVQAPMSGFFYEVFRAHPDKIGEWIIPFIGIPNRHIIYSALWMANSAEGKEALNQLALATNSTEREKLQTLLAQTPPTISTIPIDSPGSLDFLWGYFGASGSEIAVIRIADQIKRAENKANLNEFMIGQSAQWSLTSECRQNKKVLEVIKTYSLKSDSETKVILEKVMTDCQNTAPHNPGQMDSSKDFTGFWKNKCEEAFGLQIKRFGDEGKYSVVFCGPGGCGDPSESRLTYISGDPDYEVVSESELIELNGTGERKPLHLCTKDTNPVLKYSKDK